MTYLEYYLSLTLAEQEAIVKSVARGIPFETAVAVMCDLRQCLSTTEG